MQTGYTGYVDRTEWWWTTIISLTLILVTFAPFIIVASMSPAQRNIQVMGAIHDHVDSATQIARIEQGRDGQILLNFLYSPQNQQTALVHPLYAILGQVVRYSQLSPTIIFHLIRIFVSLFMFLTIYHLGAHIWVKVRTRRIFFILASVSSGFGWLATLFFGALGDGLPDLTLPQAFPLYASAANIHYPLAITCVSLIVAEIITILRPGETAEPSAQNSGLLVFVASLLLSFIYPDALIPLGIAYGLNVLANWYIQKKVTRREWYWGLWILVPALPIITYDLLAILNNEYISNWIMLRGADRPSFLMLLVGFGLPFIIAIPAIYRAIRRFEPDGDRFMILWLLSMVITAYLPLRLNQYLLLGLLIPIGYFATRAVEDFWFNYIRRIIRPRVYIVMFPFLILSHILWIFLPIYPIVGGWNVNVSNTFLESEYGTTLAWLDQNTQNEQVILASPDVSLWIPAWTGLRVVFGHPSETFDAPEMRRLVLAWYTEDDPTADICSDLIERFEIPYVVYGIREQLINDQQPSACLDNLIPIQIDRSMIYETQYANP